LTGRVWKYGNNVDTDGIIPARYLNTSEPATLARHCLADLDPSFAAGVRPGDVIVAGANFGCGSSREHAPLAIKACGVCLVVASSFARIFFRNAINIGLPLLEAPEAAAEIQSGDSLKFDDQSGVLTNRTTGRTWTGRPFPVFLREIIEAGGLVELTRRRLAGEEVRRP
jgi:3-isopropylmalate dehydratase small subunit